MTKKILKTLRSVGPSGLPRAALDNEKLKTIELNNYGKKKEKNQVKKIFQN